MTKILVADDEESIRNLMRMTLELDGYQVLMARDGSEAVEVFQKEAPELVLLDVKMPGLNGIEVLSRIRAKDPDCEVIMITGHGDMDMAVECLRKEASNFLTKPISEELLSLSLKRSLERLSLKKKLKRYTRNLETLVREANVELERAYQFRENIIENSPDAIVCIRKGGEITIFNSAAEKLLGYKKSEVIGKMHITQVYLPSEAKKIMKDLRSNEFGGPGILQKREMTLLDKEGNHIPVYISASILYEQGREAGSMGVFTDLREKKRLEKQLLRSEKLSSLGQLAAGIAHEINQPLTGVLTFSHLLLQKVQDDEESRKDLEVIVRETTRIRGIVQGILDFARESPVQKTQQHVEDIVDSTLEILVGQHKFFGIELVKEYDAESPEVVFDANLMEQVFMNIILNALDSMAGSGTLTVRTRRTTEAVEVDFTDTGKGMPEDIVEKIFDPFFTTKDSSEGMGMGLGLAISYGIVKNHNGDIVVNTRQGKGTTFTVRLPLPGKTN
ncbi:hybrid sensor histidine kinase/response regulator [Desulfomonile tiedjei]|uniref:histidine kinase n=1 Tax=Desulfomonile tiedjei (strain ATCC 49306 / DSM 6799 / DCB-1) TaxID=706587 RepID=I4C0A6_DESTA|nr:response regulator [Desulfomonile tiedjei]AFM22997.1 PAS domain S-box [Desulfomonile tiedjei DSM 6799]